MTTLEKGKKAVGKYYCRPMDWTGIWNAKGELMGFNTLFESKKESEVDAFMMRFKLQEMISENPNLPVLPMVNSDVIGGEGYWGGKIESVDIRDYVWDGESIRFRDEVSEEISDIVWTKAIVVQIGYESEV